MDPLTIALTSILGGISGAVTEHSEAKQLAKQVREQRKQLEEAANNLRALSIKEGAAAQSAYNWASAMVNKYKDNPQVLSSVSEGLNSQLTGIRNNANQFQTQAIQLLASKPATVSTKNAGLKGFLKGSMGGMGLGYSLTSNPTGENKFNLTDFVLGKFKNNTTTTTQSTDENNTGLTNSLYYNFNKSLTTQSTEYPNDLESLPSIYQYYYKQWNK